MEKEIPNLPRDIQMVIASKLDSGSLITLLGDGDCRSVIRREIERRRVPIRVINRLLMFLDDRCNESIIMAYNRYYAEDMANDRYNARYNAADNKHVVDLGEAFTHEYQLFFTEFRLENRDYFVQSAITVSLLELYLSILHKRRSGLSVYNTYVRVISLMREDERVLHFEPRVRNRPDYQAIMADLVLISGWIGPYLRGEGPYEDYMGFRGVSYEDLCFQRDLILDIIDYDDLGDRANVHN